MAKKKTDVSRRNFLNVDRRASVSEQRCGLNGCVVPRRPRETAS